MNRTAGRQGRPLGRVRHASSEPELGTRPPGRSAPAGSVRLVYPSVRHRLHQPGRRRATSTARGGGRRSAGSRAGCAARPATSPPCCRSRRSSTRSDGPASGGSACRRSRSTRSSARSTAATEFDRDFRPRTAPGPRHAGSGSTRPSAAARGCRRSTVYRVGGLHFVEDGHHRVSVARHLRPRGDRGLRDRDRHPGHAGEGLRDRASCRRRATSGSSSSGCRSPARRASGSRFTDPERGYARAGRGGRGLGLPPDARALGRADATAARSPRPGSATSSCRSSRTLAEAGPDRQRHRGRRLHAGDRDRYMLLRTHEWGDESSSACASACQRRAAPDGRRPRRTAAGRRSARPSRGRRSGSARDPSRARSARPCLALLAASRRATIWVMLGAAAELGAGVGGELVELLGAGCPRASTSK